MEKMTVKEICEKANINYNSARSYRSRHKVRDNAEVIIHFRPELFVDGPYLSDPLKVNKRDKTLAD